MDDPAALLHAELERLAQAHIAADLADFEASSEPSSNPSAAITSPSSELDIPPSFATSILAASRSVLSASQPKEQTALVSVPAGLPGDWLFRLEPPVETKGRLERALGLEEGGLKSVRAGRVGEVGEGEEEVEFVFIDDELKGSIEKWVESEGKGLRPLFVKLAKMGA